MTHARSPTTWRDRGLRRRALDQMIEIDKRCRRARQEVDGSLPAARCTTRSTAWHSGSPFDSTARSSAAGQRRSCTQPGNDLRRMREMRVRSSTGSNGVTIATGPGDTSRTAPSNVKLAGLKVVLAAIDTDQNSLCSLRPVREPVDAAGASRWFPGWRPLRRWARGRPR